MNAAAIDIGSNTVRLIVGASGRTLVEDQVIVRLGEGLHATGKIGEGGQTRLIAALQRFLPQIPPGSAIRAVATATLRRADNREAVIAAVLAATGIAIEIIGGDEEARLSAWGVMAGLSNPPDKALIADIGGGSTELVRFEGGRIVASISLPVGVVVLTERLAPTMPTPPEQLRRLLAEAQTALEPAWPVIGPLTPEHALIATAGTATTLAALELGMRHYDAEKINGCQLHYGRILHWLSVLLPLNRGQRGALAGMDPGREDLLVAGLILLHTLALRFAAPTVTIADGGLREGVLLDLLRQDNP
ncbi:MAG: exopolyphosphatase [Alphaproteobacteria bacterium CG_4_10_14_0_2_um_filter_63_37]|nr:MAG: hypothetical protein AUJ55_09400 [Proteobacteria bacterium CG1_02_64_396]PJA23959.1 MAG: exopolyphosphatase [Alphaproteobacteria bacterium CG_4_10_14_0_2_um_filter_63_37]